MATSGMRCGSIVTRRSGTDQINAGDGKDSGIWKLAENLGTTGRMGTPTCGGKLRWPLIGPAAARRKFDGCRLKMLRVQPISPGDRLIRPHSI